MRKKDLGIKEAKSSESEHVSKENYNTIKK